MIYEDQTSLIRKGLFEVQNEVGLGRHEEVYNKALTLWFQKEGIPFASKEPHPLLFDGETAHTLYPDFVVWNKITIELKAVPRRLQDPERVQIFNYLKRRNDKLGLLVNMGLDRAHIERIIFDPPSYGCTEDWQLWNDHIAGDDRVLGLKVRDILQTIYKTHQTGYGTEVTEKLIQFGLQKQGYHFTSSPKGISTFQGNLLGETPFDCILIENRLLLVFTALFDSNQFNTSRGLSFMKCLNVPWGIAVNFGKQNAQISGLSLPRSSSVGRLCHPWDTNEIS
jgi:GxxExxY protein